MFANTIEIDIIGALVATFTFLGSLVAVVAWLVRVEMKGRQTAERAGKLEEKHEKCIAAIDTSVTNIKLEVNTLTFQMRTIWAVQERRMEREATTSTPPLGVKNSPIRPTDYAIKLYEPIMPLLHQIARECPDDDRLQLMSRIRAHPLPGHDDKTLFDWLIENVCDRAVPPLEDGSCLLIAAELARDALKKDESGQYAVLA